MLSALHPLLHDDPEEHWHEMGWDLEGAWDAAEDLDGIESFRQQSVGIDIGSSTSHLIFSELILRRDSQGSRYTVTGRRTLHRSAILLTPYVSPTLIDADRLRGFIERAYAAAEMQPEDIDSGAVVITGEALKKENARPIVEIFSGQFGKFICASAGPNHEALLAAHGSGAVALSKEEQARVLVVDIGGGTTKLALIENGEVRQTAAISVGARLIAFDEDSHLTRVEEPARQILGADAPDLSLGATVSEETKEALTRRMVASLFELIQGLEPSDLTRELMLTEPLTGYEGLQTIDRLAFSGGVSEYIYERDGQSYGDLGPLLGRAIRNRVTHFGRPGLLAPSSAGIRATVIGAGEYTVQASGSTSYLSNRELLPVYALQVIQPELSEPADLEAAIYRALARVDLDQFADGLALALTLSDQLNYRYLRAVAEAIASVAAKAPELQTLFLLIDKDVAKAIGGILKDELNFAPALIAIDGVECGTLDYVDIGRPMGKTEVLPVTVKSLIFPTKAKA